MWLINIIIKFNRFIDIMSEFFNKNKIAIYGVGAVAMGLAVWLLLRDEEEMEFDPSKHTLE